MNLDQMLKAAPPDYSRTCKFAPWLATLPEDDRNAVYRAFDNPDVPSRHIYRTLKAIGCPSAESSIRAHRRRECQNCERELHGKS